MEGWKVLLVYLLIFQASSFISAGVLYLCFRCFLRDIKQKSNAVLALLWIGIHTITIGITYGLSVLCFGYLRMSNADAHALCLSLLCFIAALVCLPFIIKKLTTGSRELYEHSSFHGPQYK